VATLPPTFICFSTCNSETPLLGASEASDGRVRISMRGTDRDLSFHVMFKTKLRKTFHMVVPLSSLALAACSATPTTDTPAAATPATAASPSAPAAGPALASCDSGGKLPSFKRAMGGVAEVTTAWLAEHRCKVRVVDVREAAELVAARLPFGEHVPLGQVQSVAAERYDPSEPIVLVCRSGRRSMRAALALEEAGFTEVASMAGGMLLWEAESRPVNKGPLSAARPTPHAPASTSAPIGVDAIAAHVGDPASLKWVKAAALLLHGKESCVDGRDDTAVIGTPGGDAGELLLTLAALEHTRGSPLSDAEVRALFDAHLDAFGRFGMHTDQHAVGPLATDPRFADAIDAQGLEGFLAHPPRALEGALADALTDPAHVGCGHLRLILQHPDAYSVRPALTRALIRVALQRRWQGEPVELTLLEGDHTESAVVNVLLDVPVRSFTRIPTVAPRVGGHAIFVNHPEVTAWIREENAHFVFGSSAWTDDSPERRATFLQALHTLGKQQLGATLGFLAKGLPVYEAHIDKRGVRVVEVKPAAPKAKPAVAHQ
jgi:rhodanese-related sulfurtransferase